MEKIDYTSNRVSLIDGDDEHHHLNKIISRASSVGLSSRVYYWNSKGAVPFKWEMQPGKAKNPPRKDVIPPPSPPPAVHNRWLAKHNRLPNPQSYKESSSLSKLRFWKKKSNKFLHVHKTEQSRNVTTEFGDSDGDLTESGNDSRSSPSTSSSSSTGNSSLHQSRFGSAWNMTDVPQIEEQQRTYIYDEQGQRTACANENDGALFKTNLSRNSTINQSSRSFYQNPGSVPFEWEELPGTSKNPVKAKIIPPPSPPPAVQSLGLSTPRARFQSDPKKNSLILFLKKCKINLETKKKFQELSVRKSRKIEVHNISLASISSRSLSSRMLRNVVAKSSCYGAGKPKSIVCGPIGDS